jgi:23S rRNA pseudouridine2605 synthase
MNYEKEKRFNGSRSYRTNRDGERTNEVRRTGGNKYGNRYRQGESNDARGEGRNKRFSGYSSRTEGEQGGNRPWKKQGYSNERRTWSQDNQDKPWRKNNRPYEGSKKRFSNTDEKGQRFNQTKRKSSNYDPNAKYSNKKRIEYKDINLDPNALIRLNKFLANSGICSRREADEYITAGVVTVNGEVVTELGTKIKRTDEVKFHNEAVKVESKVYVLLNKPKNCVTTSDDPQNRKTVMDLVTNACPERIYPVGRLDRNTMGVLLLTNDGDMASKLTHPKFLKKKIYHVHLDKKVSRSDLDLLISGIELEDGEIHADAASYVGDKDRAQVGLEIHSGRNRIVRRMFEHLGYKVTKLDRVYFAGLTKKNLRRGDWRFLTEEEVNFLRMGSYE